jgi:hypothetical protein
MERWVSEHTAAAKKSRSNARARSLNIAEDARM